MSIGLSTSVLPRKRQQKLVERNNRSATSAETVDQQVNRRDFILPAVEHLADPWVARARWHTYALRDFAQLTQRMLPKFHVGNDTIG